jgi:HSP20 family protein
MDDMSRWLGGFGWPAAFSEGYAQQWAPSVDCCETENELLITAEVPGVEMEDLEVYCTEDSLVLRGESRRSDERKEQGYYRSERRYGRFERGIPLPSWVDKDRVQASFRNGVLEVRIPKTEEAKRQMRRIPIQTGQALAGMKGGEAGAATQQPQAATEGQPESQMGQQTQGMQQNQ